jgi:hypothetical protein
MKRITKSGGWRGLSIFPAFPSGASCMTETTSVVDQKRRRGKLFSVLEDILKTADEKRKTLNNTDKVKQAWSRIAISAISTYGSILRDTELDEIEQRLTKLEEKNHE